MTRRPERYPFRRLLAVAMATLLAAACESPPSATAPVAAPDALLATHVGGLSPLECPVSTSRTASALVTPLGGTVSVGGHSITIPFGALALPTRITLTELASNYVQVSIRAGDQEHFSFLEPVSITLSYARCTRSNIDHDPLTIWHVDESTGAFLEDMGGIDDKDARTVTFGSGHLSGYVIAN